MSWRVIHGTMLGEAQTSKYRHALSFLATIAFAGGFFGARLFHLALPSLMIITQTGIHFHHFWYGLLMMGVAGWVGIVSNDERLARLCAVVFGLGTGFVGDEVGLLLTFDDYYSELTLDFFVAAIAFIVLVVLVMRYGAQLEKDVLALSMWERMTQIGIFLLGFSALFFAFGAWSLGFPFALVGAGASVWGFAHRKRIRLRTSAG